jgi:hypothetical protein
MLTLKPCLIIVNQAKFWELAESLVFVKGEIIVSSCDRDSGSHLTMDQDMDMYDEKRTLVHSGPLARRARQETEWCGWNDHYVALLDNYRQHPIFDSIVLSPHIRYRSSTLA